MAKFHGVIGYSYTEETAPGVYKPIIKEKSCKGDILREVKNWTPNENQNPDLTIGNRFSIVADAFAYENYPHIRYITWENTKWAVSSVEIQRPRLILSVRGVYNG